MEIVAVVAGALLLAGTTAWALLRSPRDGEATRVRASPPTPIGEATSGALVKIAGRVEASDAGLTAPLSGRPCAAYQVELAWDFEPPRDGSPTQSSLLRAKSASVRDTGGGAINVVDASGRAWVPLREFDLKLAQEELVVTGTADEPTDALEAVLKRGGRTARSPLGGYCAVRYRELALPVGCVVAVVGVATWEFDPDAKTAGEGYRDRPRRLRIGPPARGRVLIESA